MKKLIFPAILWLLCLLQIPAIHTAALIAILLSLSFGAVGLYLPARPSCCLCLVYQLAALFWPPLLPFLPVSAYVLHDHAPQPGRLPLLSLSWLIPLLTVIPDWHSVLSIGLLCALALLLSHSAQSLEQRQRSFYELQNQTTEKALALQQKNKALMEKQDYQVQLATLTERGRLAREIHDNVGHLLTRALFQISALQVMQPENKEALGMVKTTLEDAMTNIRASVHDLHSEALDLGLELQKLIDAFPACPVTLRYHCEPVPAAIHYCFIAVVKEALSNIARHSNATSATISVLEHPALYQLIIEDNGTGGAAAKTGGTGIGLRNIEDRVSALQGNFVVRSDPGFRLFISIPKTEVSQ